ARATCIGFGDPGRQLWQGGRCLPRIPHARSRDSEGSLRNEPVARDGRDIADEHICHREIVVEIPFDRNAMSALSREKATNRNIGFSEMREALADERMRPIDDAQAGLTE